MSAAQLAEGFEAVHTRKHDVEQDEIEAAVEGAGEAILAVAGEGKSDVVAGEIFGHEGGEFLVVINK